MGVVMFIGYAVPEEQTMGVLSGYRIIEFAGIGPAPM